MFWTRAFSSSFVINSGITLKSPLALFFFIEIYFSIFTNFKEVHDDLAILMVSDSRIFEKKRFLFVKM